MRWSLIGNPVTGATFLTHGAFGLQDVVLDLIFTESEMLLIVCHVFLKYLADGAAKYCKKGVGRFTKWRAVIGKPMLTLYELSGFLYSISSRDRVGS